MLQIITLGTGSAVPTKFRNLSSTAVVRDGDIYIFDCGEGTQIQLRRAGLRPGRIKKIFISHFHGDHIFGLPGLLNSLQMAQCTQEITIYGPQGIKRFVDFHKKFSKFTLSFPLNFIEVPDDRAQDAFNESGLTITCRPLKHRARSLGWALRESDRPGKFDVAAAVKLGIPAGPLFGQLQKGESIQLADSRLISPETVVGKNRPGLHFAYCLDTAPCDNSVILAENADALVHDGTFYSKNSEYAEISGHSTVTEAAEIAAKAGVRKLILTHFSARIMPEELEVLMAEAQVIFPNVELAADLQRFTIEYRDKASA